MISIVLPYIRKSGAERCIEALKNGNSDLDFEILVEEDRERIGCPKMVKKLITKTKYDLVLFICDDTIPHEDMLTEAYKTMQEFQEGWGLVGLNDQFVSGKNHATHWLAHKKLLNYLDGEFFHTGYRHCFCDNELTERCIELNRYKYSEKAVLDHLHPIVQKNDKLADKDYARIYSPEYMNHDNKLFLSRKNNKWKTPGIKKETRLGICLPLTDTKVHSSFLDSWISLEKPSFVYIRPSFPGPIDAIRNDLVKQAIKSGCTHILMMDTDQTYPPETIKNLLSYDLDVVGGKVHRRYPPFDHLCMRLDEKVEKFYSVPDEEIEKKGLVEVDATGTGCILYKTEVFEKISEPWFEFSIGEDGKPIGEDVNFCNKLKDNGYKIFVDCSLNIGHLANLEVNYDTYKLYKFLKKEQSD